MASTRFSRFAWLTLGINVLVILWGSIVRLTGSGAGCGSHWPDCNGGFLPLEGTAKTYVEFTHRATSGIALLLVIALVIWAYRLFAKGHPVRKTVTFSLGFIIVSALVGAWIVKANLVEGDKSIARAVTLSLHFVNTMLLLASLALTARLGSGAKPAGLKGNGFAAWALVAGAIGIVVMGSSGAVTALGDTIFPAQDSLDVIQASLSPTAHFLVRLRILHPIIAITVSFYLLFLAGLFSDMRPSAEVKARFKQIVLVVMLQVTLGIANVFLKAPMALSIIHLFVADVLWVLFVMAGFAALGAEPKAANSDMKVTKAVS